MRLLITLRNFEPVTIYDYKSVKYNDFTESNGAIDELILEDGTTYRFIGKTQCVVKGSDILYLELFE